MSRQGLHNSNLNKQYNNPKSYIVKSLSVIKKVLLDIQTKEYDIASLENINLLIHQEDKPRVSKKSYNQINYILDFILEQLFDNINNLHKERIKISYADIYKRLRYYGIFSFYRLLLKYKL